MPSHPPSDAVAAGVLRDRWGIAAVPDHAAGGTSRWTWRVERRFWLAHTDATEAAEFLREAHLLEVLRSLLEARPTAWCVPRLVPTLAGEAIAVAHSGVWRLTQHVAGEELDMQDAGTYPKLARLLAEVHAVLESVPHTLAVRESGAVGRARAFLDAYEGSFFHPATEDRREVQSLEAIIHWLAPRIGALESLPVQLTHGDWTPPNIKVTQRSWRVLDWEFSRIDPVEVDLAQSCNTILMWSGLSNPTAHISKLVEAYSAHAGRRVSVANAHAAMAAYWLQNYLHWRARQEAVGGFEDVLARQPGRLHAIAEFVGAR
jgi:Ser/Thr protein kinase RdoA (MazF antagonist)